MAKNTNTAAVEVTNTNEVAAPKYAMDGSAFAGLLETHKTVSAVIRFLDSEGLKRGEIAKVTGKRYQHVRNVLTTPLKKSND